jgi:hypothetical protein
MAVLLVPEQYSTIVSAIGAAASTGDTISIAAGTYNEYVYGAGKDITYIGRTSNPADVIITHGATSYTMVLGDRSTVANLTVNYTGGSGGYAIIGVSLGGSARATATLSNLLINTTANGIGQCGWGSTFDRCRVECTYKGTGYATWGIYQTASGSGTPTSIGSTLVLDFNHAQIYAEHTTVVNSVTHTSYVRNTSLRGIYATHLYNSIASLDGSNGYSGIGVAIGGSSTHCVSFGWTSASQGDYSYGSGTTNTSNLDSADVTASGTSVFVDAANDDFNVNGSGVAFQSGTYSFQSTYGAFLNDLAGNRFNNPPSRGAYEYVAPSGGTSTNVRCRLGLKLGI